jgi:excinuclease ABC subunit C
LKRQRQVASELDEIPGIGPVTRKKLLHSFGSVRGLKTATREQVVAVVGEAKTKQLWPWISSGAQKEEKPL